MSAPPTPQVWGLPALALTLNALAWGLSWWPLRYLENNGLHALWSTALVFGCAALMLALLQPHLVRQLLHSPLLWAVMLAAGATSASFNWAVTIGDVVRVVLLFYLMPLWTVVLARWMLNEPWTPAILTRMALSVCGAVIVLWPDATSPMSWPVPHTLADALGVAGGFFFALNNVLLRKEAAREGGGCALAMFVGGALIAGGCGWWLSGSQLVSWPTPQGHWMLGVLGLSLVFLLSNLALQYGAARLPANITAMIMMSEVLFAALSTTWWTSSTLRPQVVWGGAIILLAGLLALCSSAHAQLMPFSPTPKAINQDPPMPGFYDFEIHTIDGRMYNFRDLKGKVVLIVNTASECGFTPQLAGLQALWERYKDQGLVVMGFPSNEFGGQDPGSNEEIESFCKLNYGVSFQMMSKVSVNGPQAEPLWQWLKERAPGVLGTSAIKWNFTKFLVSKEGRVIQRYAPTDKPESLTQAIENALQK